MSTYQVQDCGCIALPEELQRQTGLYPGATFEFKVAEDGSSVTLRSIHRSDTAEPRLGAVCAAKSAQA